jgi:hypothetical protein
MKDPALIKTEMVGDPGQHPDKYEYQFNSILSIDLEAGCPVWHFQSAVRHHSDIDFILLSKWTDEMDELFDKQVRNAIPHFKHYENEGSLYSDPTRYSQHIRRELTALEKLQLPPNLYAAEPVIIH